MIELNELMERGMLEPFMIEFMVIIHSSLRRWRGMNLERT